MNEDFLKEEIRDGYLVTASMKRVWACQLDLLQQLLDVCQRHGLRIWADGGTLIGAVRHHGYIPWDDDIDMIMFRSDYDRLVRLAPTEFHEPYFFQNIYSDLYYNHRHAQLRNSLTAAIPLSNFGLHYNQGIFIDIFVMDTYPVTVRAARDKVRALSLARMRLKWVEGLLRRLPRRFYASHRWDVAAFRRFEDVLRQPAPSSTPYVASLCVSLKQTIKRRAEYDETLYMPFEHLQMPVPAGYHNILTAFYGDYLTPRRTPALHGTFIFDTEHSYRHLLPLLRKGHDLTK